MLATEAIAGRGDTARKRGGTDMKIPAWVGRMFCRVGLHRWSSGIPISANFLTGGVAYQKECWRCGREKHYFA